MKIIKVLENTELVVVDSKFRKEIRNGLIFMLNIKVNTILFKYST